MNGFFKKMASASTALMLILSMVSCGSGDNTTTNPTSGSNITGRYFEQPMETNTTAVKKLKDNTLRSLSLITDQTPQQTQFGTSTDGGKTWTYESNEAVNEFFNSHIFMNGSFDDEGNLYAFFADTVADPSTSESGEAPATGSTEGEASPSAEDETEMQTSFIDNMKLYKITKDFQVEDLNYNPSAMGIGNFQVTSEGNLFFKGEDEYQQVDISTKTTKYTYPIDDPASIAHVEEGKLIVANPSEVIAYDTDTGEKIESTPFPKDVSMTENSAYNIQSSADGKGYYYYGEDGLFYFSKEGQTPELLFDGSTGSMIFSSQNAYSPTALIVNDDRSVLLGPLSTYTAEKLSYFYYDANASSVADKTISVYSLKENSYLRQVIANFNQKHSDVQVSYKTGVTSATPGSVDDALKDLSLKIQSGDIPDIMLLDGLPVEKYVQSGLFKDLSEFANKRKEEQQYLSNVLEAYTKNGELYALPAHVYTTAMSGKDLQGIRSLTDYSNWLAKQDNKKIVTQQGETFSLFYPSLYSGWFDENGKIKEDQLRTDLEAMKAIYDTQTPGDPATSFSMAGDQEISMQTIYMKMISILVGTDDINQLNGTLTSLNDYQMLVSYAKQLGLDWSLYPSEGAQLLTGDVISITKNAKNQESCEDFLDVFMTSKDLTSSFSLSETTTAKEATDEIFQKEESFGIVAGETNATPLVLEKQAITQEEISKLYESLSSLKVSATDNAVIKNILEKEINAYLGASASEEDGTSTTPQDLDTTIKNIRSKTELYLSE